MEEKKLSPAKYYEGSLFGGFSGAALKIAAMAIMLIDHIAAAFYPSLITSGNINFLMRMIGRLAFPIFAYMIAEGARRTRNTPKYLLRLFIFAFVSEFPFDHAFGFAESGQLIEFAHQNVYFTLFFGLLSIWCLQLLREKTKFYIPLSVLTLGICMAGAYLLNTDYSLNGVLCIFILYISADKSSPVRVTAFAAAILLLAIDLPGSLNIIELFALPAVIALLLYNGKKGVKLNKYFFYAFYPGHLLILWLIKIFIN